MRTLSIWIMCAAFGWTIGTVCSVSGFSVWGTLLVILVVGAAIGKLIWDDSAPEARNGRE